MPLSNGNSPEVFGLYELADDGTIRYSRARTDDGLHQTREEVIGQDFFRDIASFDNTDELRRHFRRFITADRPVDAFVFDCLFETRVVRAKIFMTKAYEMDYEHRGGIVIMDIQKASQGQ